MHALNSVPKYPHIKGKGYKKHHEEDVLPGFSLLRYLVGGDNPGITMADMGYAPDSLSSFNAFTRRLRVAVYADISFPKMGKDTASGYAALTQHFLFFTAFERYAKDVVGITRGEYHKALPFVPASEFESLWHFIKEIDAKNHLWDWLMAQRTTNFQGSNLLAFRNKFILHKGIYVSVMLRNSFAHGVLTSKPQHVGAGIVQALAERISALLYQSLATDFWERFKRQEVSSKLEGMAIQWPE